MTETQRIELARKYHAGEGITTLANEYGLSKSGIRYHLEKAGVVFGGSVFTRIESPFTRAALQKLYLSSSQREIAEIAAISLSGKMVTGATVRRWLLEADVKLRTRAEVTMLRERLGRNQHIHTAASREKQKRTLAPVFVSGKIVKFGHNFTDAERRKSGNTTRKKLAETHITRACSFCGSPVTKPPYKMRGETVFCPGYTCAVRYKHQIGVYGDQTLAHKKQGETLRRRRAEKLDQLRQKWNRVGLYDSEQVAVMLQLHIDIIRKAAQLKTLVSHIKKPKLLFTQQAIDDYCKKRENGESYRPAHD